MPVVHLVHHSVTSHETCRRPERHTMSGARCEWWICLTSVSHRSIRHHRSSPALGPLRHWAITVSVTQDTVIIVCMGIGHVLLYTSESAVHTCQTTINHRISHIRQIYVRTARQCIPIFCTFPYITVQVVLQLLINRTFFAVKIQESLANTKVNARQPWYSI